MERIVKISLAVLFIICLFKMPYGYYQLVRFLAMVVFLLLAFEIDKDKPGLKYVWFASALLINPFFKINLGREIWNMVDVIWAVILIGSLLNKKST